MQGYIMTSSRLKRGNLGQLWILSGGDLSFYILGTPMRGLEKDWDKLAFTV